MDADVLVSTLVAAVVAFCALARARSTRLLLTEVIEALPGGFVMWDRRGRLLECNQAFRDTYPMCSGVLVPGTPFEAVIRYGVGRGQFPQALGREDEFVREMVAAHRRGGQTAERLLPGGRWILIHEERTRSGNVVAIRSDITAFKRALAEAAEARDVVRHMAHHDALTGLPNRVLFRERLDAALDAWSAGGPPPAVLYMDLDRFKEVNDRHGHGTGDELLAAVAARLRAEVRTSDTVARLGGDEFAVVLAGGDPATEAGVVASRIIASVSEPFRLATGFVTVGMSVGAALPAAGSDARDVVARADEALYDAKRAGRGVYRCSPAPSSDPVQAAA